MDMQDESNSLQYVNSINNNDNLFQKFRQIFFLNQILKSIKLKKKM